MVLLSSLVWFSSFGIPFREEASGSVLVLLSSRERGFLLPWQERGSLRHPAHLSIHCCLRLACAVVILSRFLFWSCCMQIQFWLSVSSVTPIPEHPEAGRARGLLGAHRVRMQQGACSKGVSWASEAFSLSGLVWVRYVLQGSSAGVYGACVRGAGGRVLRWGGLSAAGSAEWEAG